MSRGILVGIIVVLLVVIGYFAYSAYEQDQNSLEIQVGPNGIKVDPPGR